jgi:hypothetical protein
VLTCENILGTPTSSRSSSLSPSLFPSLPSPPALPLLSPDTLAALPLLSPENVSRKQTNGSAQEDVRRQVGAGGGGSARKGAAVTEEQETRVEWGRGGARVPGGTVKNKAIGIQMSRRGGGGKKGVGGGSAPKSPGKGAKGDGSLSASPASTLGTPSMSSQGWISPPPVSPLHIPRGDMAPVSPFSRHGAQRALEEALAISARLRRGGEVRVAVRNAHARSVSSLGEARSAAVRAMGHSISASEPERGSPTWTLPEGARGGQVRVGPLSAFPPTQMQLRERGGGGEVRVEVRNGHGASKVHVAANQHGQEDAIKYRGVLRDAAGKGDGGGGGNGRRGVRSWGSSGCRRRDAYVWRDV